MRFGYADPPYPKLARRYYGKPEVDHRALVRRMADNYPDGWALSTSAVALPLVLQLVRERVADKNIRVAIWVKGSRKGISYRARNAYEPVIIVRGRPRQLDVAEALDDVLIWGGRQHSHPGALVGMKPAPFCEWLFRMLGAQRGDELHDVFPGSGAVTRAWRMYTREPSRVDERRKPSRLAGAMRRLK